jgi:hypothetical protein
MWKEYADDRKGFVVAFSPAPHAGFGRLSSPGKVGKVSYSDQPYGTYLGMLENERVSFFFRKRTQYAFEWRSVRALRQLQAKPGDIFLSPFDHASVCRDHHSSRVCHRTPREGTRHHGPAIQSRAAFHSAVSGTVCEKEATRVAKTVFWQSGGTSDFRRFEPSKIICLWTSRTRREQHVESATYRRGTRGVFGQVVEGPLGSARADPKMTCDGLPRCA